MRAERADWRGAVSMRFLFLNVYILASSTAVRSEIDVDL